MNEETVQNPGYETFGIEPTDADDLRKRPDNDLPVRKRKSHLKDDLSISSFTYQQLREPLDIFKHARPNKRSVLSNNLRLAAGKFLGEIEIMQDKLEKAGLVPDESGEYIQLPSLLSNKGGVLSVQRIIANLTLNATRVSQHEKINSNNLQALVANGNTLSDLYTQVKDLLPEITHTEYGQIQKIESALEQLCNAWETSGMKVATAEYVPPIQQPYAF